jgi:hypothetical protein
MVSVFAGNKLTAIQDTLWADAFANAVIWMLSGIDPSNFLYLYGRSIAALAVTYS